MTWFEELERADFAGHRFGVRSTQVAGGVTSTAETVVGHGSRKRALASGPRTYQFEAFFAGADVLPRVRAFTARLEQGPGLLVHPHFGAADVLCDRWSVAFRGHEIEFAEVSLEFSTSELPVVPEPAQGLTAPIVLDEVVTVAAGFTGEVVAAAELASIAPDLGLPLEPPDEVPAAVTRRLLESPGPPQTGVPGALQSLGSGLHLFEAGQLLAADRDAVANLLLREAIRADSTALMAMRQLWLELVRETGPAEARRVEGDGRTLAAIAVAAGLDLSDVAARNRELASGWFARGEVQL